MKVPNNKVKNILLLFNIPFKKPNMEQVKRQTISLQNTTNSITDLYCSLTATTGVLT